MIELGAGPARATVIPEAGGRVGALAVGGVDILVPGTADDDPMLWGSFPMAPWAGRIGGARFTHDGETFEVPANLGPHAGHGTTFERPWTVTGAGATWVELACELGEPWPLGGTATQRIELTAGALRGELAVTAADRSMPAEVGWHPWFATLPSPSLADAVRSAVTAMYERGPDGLPTGRLVPPSTPPWDDCFTITAPFRLPVAPGVTLASDCDHVVVFDGLERGVAVEPQSGPPDAFRLRPRVLAPGATLRRWMAIAWEAGVAEHGSVTGR